MACWGGTQAVHEFPRKAPHRVGAPSRSEKSLGRHCFDNTVRLRVLLPENRIGNRRPTHPTIKNGVLPRSKLGATMLRGRDEGSAALADYRGLKWLRP